MTVAGAEQVELIRDEANGNCVLYADLYRPGFTGGHLEVLERSEDHEGLCP